MGEVRSVLWKRAVLYCFFFLIVANVFAISSINFQKADGDVKLVTIENVIQFIKEKNDINFLYSSDLFNSSQKVRVNFEEESWESLLKQALEPFGYSYKMQNNIVVINRNEKKTVNQSPQQVKLRNVTGNVIDENGEPLPGATVGAVSASGNILYTVTDSNGHFKVQLQGDETNFTVTFIGFKDKVIPISEDVDIYNIMLESEINGLGEVVVTGIFDRPKASFTGAATVITKKQIQSFGNRNLLTTLSNIDPSLDIKEQNKYGSDPNNTTLDIEIRGASSITDVDNLNFQTRGALNTPLFILDGFEVSVERVLDMNQNDVESVVILKDASATAIYGSRGANGVVVITSSHPPVGKLRVTYTAGLNFEIPDLSSYDLLNSKEKLEIEQIAGMYTDEDPDDQVALTELFNTNNKATQEGVNTNWLKVPTRVGLGQYHHLNIGGGDQQFRYDLNVSYNKITGAMKGSDRENINTGLNIQYVFEKVRVSNQLELGFNKGVNSMYGEFNLYYNMNPYWRPYDENGDPIVSYDTFDGQTQYNPLYDASLSSFSTTDYNNIRNQTSVSINFSPNLKWDSSLGITILKGGSDYFLSPLNSVYLISSIDLLSRGSYTQSSRDESSYQISTTLSYGKTFGDHSLFLGVNGQMMENQKESMSINVKGFTNEKLNDISNAITYSGDSPTTSESTTRSVGVTGTINYNYANKYFVEGSGRLDGASSFGSESRFAPFYAMGLAWDISQENFIKDNLYFLNRAKLRYSYGVTGSLNFSAYQALTTYSYDTENQYTNISGMTIMALGNKNLKWQNTTQQNWGIDIQALDNRLGITFNYYRKMTDNLIGEATLPYSNGFTSYTENFGTVRNTGIDANFSFNIVRIPAKQFSWFVTAGVYHNKNILVKLSEAIKEANEYWENLNVSDDTYYQYREGESIDELYVLKSPGVDPLTGEVLYEDPLTGNITTTVGGLRKIAVGSTLPKINGRFGTSVKYKGLTMDVNFSLRLGAKKMNNSLLRVENAYVKNNVDRRVLDTRWQEPGDITAFKNIASDDNTYPNDRFVFTERTLRMSNVNVSYQFPTKFVRSLGAEQIYLTGSVSDVFYASNIKMERGTSYPYAIRPTFNLSVTF